MALEVIGGIASIAQLAGTVYTLSKTLYEVSESLSNASAEITDLARDLETFAEELNLLSTLLHGKDGRYADRIYRLTAKIIGDCATICQKIDRIIRKSRSGRVWGKVKWLYKEKEILKLLARLRDLKLSLMSTLSVLSALRADYMMDSLGIQHASLLGGPKDQALSDETIKEVEDTKAKLASISLNTNSNTCTAKSVTKTNPSKASSYSSGSSLTLSASSITPTSPSSSVHGRIGGLGTGVSPFMSNVVMPVSIPMQNLRALESVDSFHSAISHLDDDDGGSSALAGEARGAAPASGVQSHSVPLLASRGPPNFMSGYRHNCGGRKTHTTPIASSSSSCQAEFVSVALMAGGRRPDIARNAGDKALPSDEEDAESPTQNLPDPDPSHPIFLQARNVAVGDSDGSNESIAKQQEAVTVWREEMIISTMKNIGMAREDAEAWVMSLPSLAARRPPSQTAQPASIHPPLRFVQARKREAYHEYPTPYSRPRPSMIHDTIPQSNSSNQSAESMPPIGMIFDRMRITPPDKVQSPQAPCSEADFYINHEKFDLDLELNEEIMPEDTLLYPCSGADFYIKHEKFDLDLELNDGIMPEDTLLYDKTCPVMSALYAESSPASDTVGELWFKALKALALDTDDAANALQSCLDHTGIRQGDSYSTTPIGTRPWSVDGDAKSLTISCHRLPGAETPVQQIVGILNVMKQTMGFKSGVIVWPCLTSAAENMVVLDRGFSEHERLVNLRHLAEIATIVARYTVMESIYSNWKGMSLEKDYESALINLSTHVLRYIGLLLKSSLHPEKKTDMKVYFDNIQRADAACRGFSAVISTDDMHDDREVEVEDVSDDSDTSSDMVEEEKDSERKLEVESGREGKRQRILDVGS